MTTASLPFPPSFNDLGGMPNAQLLALSKKLQDQIEGLPDNYKGLTHFMSKTEKVEWIGAHHYGSGQSVEHVMPAAKAKYAQFLTKAAAKKAANAAPKGMGGAINCTATAMKELENLASTVASAGELPKMVMMLADFEQFAASSLGDVGMLGSLNKAEMDALLGQLQSWKTAFKALDNIDSGLAASEIEQAVAMSNNLSSLKNIVEGLADPALQKVDLAATKIISNSLSGMKAQVAKMAEDLGTTPPDKVGFMLDILNAKSKQVGKVISEDTLHSLPVYKVTGQLETPSWDAVVNALDDLSSFNIEKNLLAVDQDLLNGTIQNVIESLNEHLSLQTVPKLSTVEQQAAKEVLEKVAAKATVDNVTAGQLKAAASEVEDHFSAIDFEKFVVDFANKPNVELKQLALEALDQYPDANKSLAYYLDKDQKVELLAKIKADPKADIKALTDAAQTKYVEHQAGLKAKKFGNAVADSSTKSADEVVAALKTDPTGPLPNTMADELAAQPNLAAPHPVEMQVLETESKKPAHTELIWKQDSSLGNPGGGHTKALGRDQHDDVWMWKTAESKGVAEGETLAHEIGWKLNFDMSDIRLAERWDIDGVSAAKSRYGTVQKFHSFTDPVSGKPLKAHNLSQTPIESLTPEQLAQVQQHQVFDWLISQHDTHAENLVVNPLTGDLLPIDKGQAFKFFNADKLSSTYKPSGNFGNPVYNDMWKSFESGRIKLDLDSIDGMLAKVESLSDAEYRAQALTYAKQRFADAGPRFLPAELSTPEKLADAMLGRKQTIRADFEAFYRAEAKKAGVSWEPAWAAKTRDAAKVLRETGDVQLAQATQAGITTPISAELAESVKFTGSAGQSLHLAGEEITNGQALLWAERNVDGSDILRIELRLERQADMRVYKTFADAAGDAGTGGSKVTAGVNADTAYNPILSGAKTVNTHAADGAYNEGTLSAMNNLKPGLAKEVNAAKQADRALADGKLTIEEWAAKKAEGEKAEQYLGFIDSVNEAKTGGLKTVPKTLVQQFDLNASQQGWLAKAPKSVVTEVKTAVEEKLFSVTPKVMEEQWAVMQPVKGPQVLFQRTGELKRHSQLGSREQWGKAQQYEATINVDGTDVVVRYRAWDMTGSVPSKGRLDAEILNWDGTQESVDKIMRAVNRLGVDTKLATVTDEELTYWRVTTGSMRASREGSSYGGGSGSYGQVRSTIDAIESRVAKTPGISADDEIKVYREEWAKVFGQDNIDKAYTRLAHTHDVYGRATGYGHFERFDLPENLQEFYAKGGKQLGLSHGVSSMPTDFLTNFTATPAGQEQLRLGIYGQLHTTSLGADMQRGSGQGIFYSHGFSHWQSGKDVVILNPSKVLRRASTYSNPDDSFGALAERTTGNALDPAAIKSGYLSGSMRGSNEAVVKFGGSWGDDMELTFMRSNSKREAVLKDLRAAGVEEIRGVKIEERIRYAADDADVVTQTNAWFKANPQVYTERYSDAVTGIDRTLSQPAKRQATRAAQAVTDSPTSTTVSAAPTSADGALGAIEKTQNAIGFGEVPNSVKAKLTSLSKNLNAVGAKTNVAQLQAELDAYVSAGNSGYGFGYLPDLSKTKQVNSFLAHKAAKAEIDNTIGKLDSLVDKVSALDGVAMTPAKKDTLLELFNTSYDELFQEFKVAKNAGEVSSIQEYVVAKAKQLAGDVAPGPAHVVEGLNVTVEQAAKIQKLLDAGGSVGGNDVGNVLGLDKEQVFQAWGNVAGKPGSPNSWLDFVKGLAEKPAPGEAKTVEEIGFKVVGGKIETPIAKFDSSVINQFTDEAYNVKYADMHPANALQAISDQTGVPYADLKAGMNKYAQNKGLSYSSDPAAVLDAFAQDMGKALSNASAAPKVGLLDVNGAKGTLLKSSPTKDVDVGSWMTAPLDDAKTFKYGVGGTKVSVVFEPAAGGGTNVLVQQDGAWFLLKATSSGKTSKDEIIELLKKVGHKAAAGA